MRKLQVPRQLLAAVISGVLAGGCGLPDFIANPVGVGSPKPTAITEYLNETETGSIQNGASGPITAGEYVIASMAYTNDKCHNFFDTLERFKEDSSLIDKVLTAAAAAGSPLFAAASASGTAVAKFAAVINSVNQINTSYRDIYTFKEFQEPLQTHVFGLMADFRKKNGLSTLTRSLVGVKMFEAGSATAIDPIDPVQDVRYSRRNCQSIRTAIPAPSDNDANHMDVVEMDSCKFNDFLVSRQPIHLLIARNLATEYASLCSIATMKSIVYQALHATKTDVKSPDSSAPETKATQ